MNGIDWNGNGRVDAGDWYIDYEIMNNEENGGGGNHGSGGGSGGGGCGCLTYVFMFLVFIYLLGSCS